MYGKLSQFDRKWAKGVVVLTAGYFTYRTVQAHAPNLKRQLTELIDAGKKFFEDHVKQRLLDIYDTIRHDSAGLKLIDAASVAASEESLVRMVTEFVEDQYAVEKRKGNDQIGSSSSSSGNNNVLTASEFEEIARKAEKGDLSPIMPAYERAIKHPITGALFGQFIRLALIQVQKQKVFGH